MSFITKWHYYINDIIRKAQRKFVRLEKRGKSVQIQTWMSDIIVTVDQQLQKLNNNLTTTCMQISAVG